MRLIPRLFDKAESDAETAEKINVLEPENLAKTGIPLIQISTDYVFDGRNCRPYNEDDEPHPQSVWPDETGRRNGLFCKMRQRRLLFICGLVVFDFRQ